MRPGGDCRSFLKGEDDGAMTVLSYWIKAYRIFQSLCCDSKSTFVLACESTDAVLFTGITAPKGHFGTACVPAERRPGLASVPTERRVPE
jgi:hypothetical protein